LEFSLTKEEFVCISEQICHYCGCAPERRKAGPTLHSDWAWNGIDRKDNNYGYTTDNCVACCILCNLMKGSLPYQEFINWIAKAYRHIGMAASDTNTVRHTKKIPTPAGHNGRSSKLRL
jgi:hypothetical protein